MNQNKFNKIFSAVILIGMSVCVVLSCIGKMQVPGARHALLIISAFGALMGVASTVLSANGSIWNFLFGVLDVSIYSYILYDSGMTSQFLLHVLYILPMEFVGLWKWRKRGASGHSQVRAQRMNGRNWIKYALLFAGVLVASFCLDYFVAGHASAEINFQKMGLDAVITTANIVALAMMAFAYYEQWYLWTIVNLSSVVIWSITLAGNPDAGYAIIPLVKYSFYFINGINGLRIWYGLSKGSDLENREKIV